MAERPNVLLIVVDACRADYVEPYGDGAETPAVASLAAEGTVFRRTISPAPWTLPSVTSLLTGKYSHERRLSEGTARGADRYATVVRRALASETPLRSLGNALAFELSEAAGDAWRSCRRSDSSLRT